MQKIRYKTKICTKCGKQKYLSEFHKSSANKKDGHKFSCKKCESEYHKKRYIKNKKSILHRAKNYRDKNKEKRKQSNQKYYNKNKRKISKQSKRWKKNNKEKVLENQYNYVKKRRQTDIRFKIEGNLRSRLTLALRGKDKALSTMFLIGCEIDYLMFHIQSKYKPSMSWDNYGYGKSKWVIDHIIPCSKFDLSKSEEQLKCFNYKNLQPLWFQENINKGNK